MKGRASEDLEAAVASVKETDASGPKTDETKQQEAEADEAEMKPAKQEEQLVDEEDPKVALRNKILQIIKNGFSIARSEDEEIQISVDNVYPLLKALELNPQNDSVMDMVREACMESSGEIQPAQFEAVVMSLVKIQDDELWGERLEEKARDALKESSEKAKAEAERMKRLEQGLGEEEDSWEEMERKIEAKKKEQELERQTDELYDNIQMAFRFIDSDEDGVISVQDLYNLMMGLGEMLDDDELYGMVVMADLDCDGKLTFKDFKRFLLKGTPDEIGSEDEYESSVRPAPPAQTEEDEAPMVETDLTNTEEKEKKDAKSGEVKEEATPTKFLVPEPKEEPSERAKRRKSMLYGYSAFSSVRVEKKDDISEEDKKTSEENAETTADTNTEDENTKINDETEDAENHLNAIKEVDEHSNYDMNEVFTTNIKTEQKATALHEGKRKYFSRQSSSASLKNKTNSITANSESTVEDSGFETLDTNVDCSEIREVPDVFDISEDESELQNLAESQGSKSRETGDYDEDKINEECVRESLSRFSIQLEDNIESSSDDETVVKRDVRNAPCQRRDEFSNEHMYYELERSPTEDEIQQQITEEIKTKLRFTRAQMLQKAILKRAHTMPALIRYVPKSPDSNKTNVNGIKCSHIDIDLRCETPPKADIKSVRQFNDRVQSARTRPKSAYFDNRCLRRKMSIVDMAESFAEDSLVSDRENRRRQRPLTAPRSPWPPRRSKDAWENESQTPRTRRSQSAVQRSVSPVSRDRQPPRPQTANLTYTTPRRTIPDLSCVKLQKMGEFTVVTSEPFAKSDELYPRKSLLTSYHHGFRSVWPIGRNINVLQNKRPFDSFEMNSYSRAIEREEIPPLKSNVEKENKENVPKFQTKITKTIRLELDTENIVRPKIKRPPSLLPCHFTPRTVR